jgi:hypothetical protein
MSGRHPDGQTRDVGLSQEGHEAVVGMRGDPVLTVADDLLRRIIQQRQGQVRMCVQ